MEELDQLYDTHARDLYAFLVYRTGSPELAEDVLADTFERALRQSGRFDSRKGSEKTWLYAIALNRLKDLRRRAAIESRALERMAGEATGFVAGPEEAHHDPDLYVALGRLPRKEREALALRFGADLTVPEIAHLLNEPLSRVEGRVYRALRKLRKGYDGPHGP